MMRAVRRVIETVLILALLISASMGLANAQATVVASMGKAAVQGRHVIVEVLVVVQPGQNARDVAHAALAEQGARPFESAELGSGGGFTTTGLLWGPPSMVQNYNPDNEPNGGELLALQTTHGTWNGVGSSAFTFIWGSLTVRCPSLVKECRGPQVFDGLNDVGWARLGPNTLGVTWFGNEEADIALNTLFNWGVSGFDVETVLLHENGHVAGLGHSDLIDASMYPTYQTANTTLHPDDEEGITYLYDYPVTGEVSGSVTDFDTGVPVSGATVEIEGTSLYATSDLNGSYTIKEVPDPVTYTLTASASGFESDTLLRVRVEGVVTEVDEVIKPPNFVLVSTSTPPPEQGPEVLFCDPNNGNLFQQLTVRLAGTDFQDGATVDFGSRIAVRGVSFVDSGALDVQIKIHPRASAGTRDVTVTNPDGQSGTLVGCFTVN